MVSHADDTSSNGDSWATLVRDRDLLLHDLHVARASQRSQKLKEATKVISKCQHCGTEGPPVSVQCPLDLPRSDGLGRFTSWGFCLRALRTPHCRSCCSVTPLAGRGPIHSLVDRVALGAPLAWEVCILPCVCCSKPLASDAMACFHCGTSLPRGGLLQHGKLQRCARCGAGVARDAGLCLTCGTSNFRPAGFFSAGPADIRLLDCPSCGHALSADAYLCVHCGDAWPAPSTEEEQEGQEEDEDGEHSESRSDSDSDAEAAAIRVTAVQRRRRYLTLVEAVEENAVKLSFLEGERAQRAPRRALPCPAG
mmetsp:Transcript_7992/g.17813  ORF Transcript_7992/g.17813 Transcript_7992/m.17813 type:complete len:309 (+) Transcript_7992:64-990(+)